MNDRLAWWLHQAKRSWTFHNDLSGKEWIPHGEDGANGWWEDVPKRIYIGTPWGHFTLAPDRENGTPMWFPWKVKNRHANGGRSHYSDRIWSPVTWSPRSRQPAPRRSHVQLILNKLCPEPSEIVQHLIDNREMGLALIEALAEVAAKPHKDRIVHLDVRSEVDEILADRKVSPSIKLGISEQLRKTGTYFELKRPIQSETQDS